MPAAAAIVSRRTCLRLLDEGCRAAPVAGLCLAALLTARTSGGRFERHSGARLLATRRRLRAQRARVYLAAALGAYVI